MRPDRPSLTASLVAAVRALYAELPPPYNVAPDDTASALLPGLLALPARAARHAGPLAPAVHLGLGRLLLGITYHVPLRTLAIDEALREALRAGASQVVLLGAGLDNRARRIPELSDSRVFEIDHPGMQRYKLERMARAGCAPPENVTLVPVDFERDRLDRALCAAGVSASERSFWIWEGVTVYLTPEAIDATLEAVAASAAPGSRIALTYSRPGAIGGPALSGALHKLADVIGEPVRGMLETREIAARLERAGFSVLTDENAVDWAARAWPNAPSGLREWERLVVAERREQAEGASRAA